MELRRYQGQDFAWSQLRHLNGDFRSSFDAVIRRFSSDPFLTVRHQGQILHKTFQEFAADVRLEPASQENLLIIEAFNDYSSVVRIFASLVNQRTLALMNPRESDAQKKRKRTQLNELKELGLPKQGDLVYVFTSGSTGDSKIVRQSESGVLSNVEALIRHHGLEARPTILTPLPIFHVNALEFTLMAGFFSGSQVILTDTVHPRELTELIQTHRAQIFSLVPPVLRTWLDFLEGQNARAPESLQYLVSAATALSKELTTRTFEQTGLQILQGYGLSEAVNFSCAMPKGLSKTQYLRWMTEEKFPSIGVALWGNDVAVLDDLGKTLPAGQVGELVIRGFNVMNGYVADSNLDVFQGDWLHTGDLGYFLEENGARFFFVCGRKKDMIKRFGETIPLREIDDLVASLSISGLDAIAVGFPNQFAGEELALVCRAENPPANWRETLLSELSKLFEVGQRPRLVLEVQESLRTPSGKPQRHRFTLKFLKFENTRLGAEPSLVSDEP